MGDPKRLRPMGLDLPIGNDPASVRRRIEALEVVLERSFVIPVVKRQVGLDAIIGLVPVAGDIIAAVIGSYLIWEARNLGLSRWQQMRMAGNIAFDTTLGAVPLVGDLFDFLYRSNSRNLRIVRRHLDKHHPASAVIVAQASSSTSQ